MFEKPVWAHPESEGRQIVDVAVDRGYHPSAIFALAGIPLRLVFNRSDDDARSERVIFSDPRLDRPLAAKGLTVVDLPGRPAGTVRFTCGMGRYHGTIKFAMERPGAMAPSGGRRRWLMPGLAIGIGVAALVVTGVLSASTALYAGLIGGMILMHLGGHGAHGGGHGGGHGFRDSETARGAEDLEKPSSATQDKGTSSSNELGDRGTKSRKPNERDDEDQLGHHGCH